MLGYLARTTSEVGGWASLSSGTLTKMYPVARFLQTSRDRKSLLSNGLGTFFLMYLREESG
jgi:hypothetical protein